MNGMKMFSLLLFCTLSASFVNIYGLKRNVVTKSWPNCDDFPHNCTAAKNSSFNLVYSMASTSKKDNLHYAFSTQGALTVVYALTEKADVTMYFDYDKMMSKSPLKDVISFKGAPVGWTPEYKFGLAFTKLIEFNDTDDSADLKACQDKNESMSITEFGKFSWIYEPVKDNEFMFRAAVEREDPVTNETASGNITFTFAVRGDDGRDDELPRLKYNANTTQFDFEVDQVTPLYPNSRFAVETMLASTTTNKDMALEQSRSIDDEYAPGVFLITDWLSDPDNKPKSGFLQWKPVAYLAKERARKVVTKVKDYSMVSSEEKDLVEETLLYGLFGDDLWNEKMAIHKLNNISFGLSEDGFYTKNNYTVWAAAVGYGIPPRDELSTTVIIIIAVGLGLPVVIILIGGLYLCTKRLRKRGQPGYDAIGSDDGLSHTNPQVN